MTERDSNGNEVLVTTTDANGNTIQDWTTVDAYTNANGNVFDGSQYWTQTLRFDHATVEAQIEAASGFAILQWRADRYADWEKMHQNVLWFDTAACLDGGHIGKVNQITITPATPRYKRRK